MKHNDLKRLLKTIQFRTEKTIEEIAGEIGYARAYLTDQVNKGNNETIRKILTEKYGKYLEQSVSYNTPTKSLEAQGGQKSTKSNKDTLTTVTQKPDYGMKPTNGHQSDKDHVIKEQAEAANKYADAYTKQADAVKASSETIKKLVDLLSTKVL